MPIKLDELVGDTYPLLYQKRTINGREVRSGLEVECPDGSIFTIPKSWQRCRWSSYDQLKEAIQRCLWLDSFDFDDHIVLTYAPVSYAKSFGEWQSYFLQAGTLTQKASAYMKEVERLTTKGPKRPSTAKAHLDHFIQLLNSEIGRSKKLYYLAVIETLPRTHIHILTRNTRKLTSRDVRRCWPRGACMFNHYNDDVHQRDTVRYLYKSFGEADHDVRFNVMMPKGFNSDSYDRDDGDDRLTKLLQ